MKRVVNNSSTEKQFRVVVVENDGFETTLPYSFNSYEKAEDFCRIYDWKYSDRYCSGQLKIVDIREL